MDSIRNPQTTNEMRQTALHEAELEEFGVRIRGKRRRKNLPQLWDDMSRSDAVMRSWKHHRDTQYRAAA